MPPPPELPQRLAEIAGMQPAEKIALYGQLRGFEGDFDKAQSTLRTIASAWLIAAIGGIGLITQGEYGQYQIDGAVASVLRQLLLLFAAAGFTALWYLDQRVYQRLLHAVFAIGMKLEETTPGLLPVRRFAYSLNLDITNLLGWFYRAPLYGILVIALANCFQATFGFQTSLQALVNCSLPGLKPVADWGLSFAVAIVHVALFLFISSQARTWPTLSRMEEELTTVTPTRPPPITAPPTPTVPPTPNA